MLWFKKHENDGDADSESTWSLEEGGRHSLCDGYKALWQPDVFNFFARQSDKLELWYDGKKDCANNIFFLQNSQTGYIIETTSLFTIYIYIMFVLEYWKMHLVVQVYHNLLQINTKKIWNCI